MAKHFLSEHQEIEGTSKTVLDYWKWAYSSVLNNTQRGIFAEFLVGNALGVLTKPRVEWDNADLKYRNFNVEVKSSAYIQEWEQPKPSMPKFRIAPKLAWNGIGNNYEGEKRLRNTIFFVC